MQAPSPRKLPTPLLLFAWVLFALAALSLLDLGVSSLVAGQLRPGDFWIIKPGFDFYDYTPRFPYLHQRQFFTVQNSFPWVYPAPAILVLYPFYLISTPTHWHLGYALFALLGITLALICGSFLRRALLRRNLSSRQILILLGAVTILGWPFYFALQRGNIELLLWPGIAAAVYLIVTDREVPGALLLGVVGSAKTYPLLFIGLLLLKKRFRDSLLALGAALATTLLGLRVLEPDVADAWYQIQTGVARWTQITGEYLAWGVGPDHSLLGLLRQCTFGAVLHSPRALPTYLITAALTTTLLFFGRVRCLPVPNQVLFITCAAILLPPTSYDYTLLLLLIPWAWMVLICAERSQAGLSTAHMTPLFVTFAVAFAPLNFLHTYGSIPVRFEGPARSVALLGLLVMATITPFPAMEGGRMTRAVEA